MPEKHAPFSLWFQARSGTFALGFHVLAFEKRGCKIGACVWRPLLRQRQRLGLGEGPGYLE